MAGKTCMITGSNSGIGKATAVALARMGASIVMVCRDGTRGEAARAEIAASSGAKDADVVLMVADLASLDSVRALATQFLGTGRRLDVLINNAGLILGKRTVTGDGLETTFAVNYLSHFLLTNLLLEKIKAAAPSRIINVSSSASDSGHMHFDDLQLERGYSAIKAYGQSKLAQILFTRELARKLQGTGVTVNAVHPGVVATNWGRRSTGPLGLVLKIGSPFMMSPEKGAETSVYLASSPDVAGITGRYFVKKKEATASAEATDDAAAARLWEASLALSGLPGGS
ncbi:MAG: SDR family oxidoreductase [Nitrososphaerales archaeon]